MIRAMKREDISACADILCRVYNNELWMCHWKKETAFSRETWHGRMRACRGVGASMQPETIKKWEEEHRQMLLDYAPEKFNIKHYISIAQLEKKTRKEN